jgi:Putative prokaryotic signal transducing protein
MKFLVQAHTMQQGAEIQMLRALLAEAGIDCLIRNESLAVAMGEIPVSECFPELWLLNDSDHGRAAAIIAEWRSSDGTAATPWVCPTCGESIEGQFGACWKCGGEAPEPEDDVAP